MAKAKLASFLTEPEGKDRGQVFVNNELIWLVIAMMGKWVIRKGYVLAKRDTGYYVEVLPPKNAPHKRLFSRTVLHGQVFKTRRGAREWLRPD